MSFSGQTSRDGSSVGVFIRRLHGEARVIDSILNIDTLNTYPHSVERMIDIQGVHIPHIKTSCTIGLCIESKTGSQRYIVCKSRI